ncbi:MAG: heparan-alpha-glucosaminide N-acetyltransferase domain-containing protein [Terriglobia bacterium]
MNLNGNSPRSSRLVFIDLFRGIAILAMIETHVFNAFLDTTYRSKDWFHHLNYFNGLVAPSFLFISGWVFIVSSRRKVDDFRSLGPAFRKQLWRIAQIWILGYCLHFPKYSYSIARYWTSTADWQRFYTVDILQCIAVGLLGLLAGRIVFHQDRRFEAFLWGISLTIVAVTPWVWEYRFPKGLPASLVSYFQEGPWSYFPLFPWLGFFGIGAACAMRHLKSLEAGIERHFFQIIGMTALFLVVAGHWLPLLDFPLSYVSPNIRAQPVFWGERLGYVLALVVLCRLFQERGPVGTHWLQVVSRESLMVYAAHLFLIYRIPYREMTLFETFGQSLSLGKCLLLTFGMVVLMIFLARFWSWMKTNHMTAFRVGLSTACALLVIGFFLR